MSDPVENLCSRFCRDCIHRDPNHNYCIYILNTNKRRPCPAGNGCTVKEIEMGKATIWNPETDAELLRMRADGVKIADCAEHFAVAEITVQNRLKKLGATKTVKTNKSAPKPAETADLTPNVPNPVRIETPEQDVVNHPAHYTAGGIECIDAIRAATTGLIGFEAYCTGTVIKYLWRWKHKNGLEDLRKAGVYLDWLMQEVANE